MNDPIHELYESQTYPAMSHPVSDPAVTAVAARMAGLKTAPPGKARILEVGCCSGHNLIPLAMRWPEGEWIGIDQAEGAIREARRRAAVAGIRNIQFHAVDLRDFKPAGGTFDYIIAHGVFSWVPDEVKAALLLFCADHLSPAGIATISFNLESGWAPRLPLIQKTRAIQQARGGGLISALEILRFLTPSDSPEMAIIDDMLEKGPEILVFDDFSPVNDPWRVDQFIPAAANAGLRWLGESDPAGNFPSCLDADWVEEMEESAADPIEFQQALDDASVRTFRSGMLCRMDAPVEELISSGMVFEMSVRAGVEPVGTERLQIWRALRAFAPACVPLREVAAALPELDVQVLAALAYEGFSRGWILPRIEPFAYDSDLPRFPKLNAFRRLCASEELPLVDAWHRPCQFPQAHYAVLAAMDGTRSISELAGISKRRCPELAFEPWLKHLADRGMFS